MSAAIFTRRAKSGWLDELDGIRDDALAHPGGGVEAAMSDVDQPDDVEGSGPAPEQSPVTPLEAELPPPPSATAPPPPALVDPSPHPSRPQEMWHPGIDLGRSIAPPPPPKAVADPDPAASREPETEPAAAPAADGSGRFSFARLRAVLPSGDTNEPALSDAPVAEGEERTSLLSELVAPYGAREAGDAVAATGQPEDFWTPVERFEAPVVPPTVAPTGQSLISGPVQRRDARGPVAERRLDLPAIAVETPPEIAEPVAVELEPVPEPEPVPVGPIALGGEADGTFALADGHLRFATPPAQVPTSGPDGVRAVLTNGWCWIRTGADQSAAVAVQMSSLVLRIGSSTTALVAMESDGATFVVIAAGEATLEHPDTRLHLRRGAMALTAAGSEPQVDMATDEEIATDPLVAQNQDLDLAR